MTCAASSVSGRVRWPDGGRGVVVNRMPIGLLCSSIFTIRDDWCTDTLATATFGSVPGAVGLPCANVSKPIRPYVRR